MDVFDVFKKRRSVRRFLEEPIEVEKLNVVLEAGRLALSAINLQEWRFVVMDPKVKRKIAIGCQLSSVCWAGACGYCWLCNY